MSLDTLHWVGPLVTTIKEIYSLLRLQTDFTKFENKLADQFL